MQIFCLRFSEELWNSLRRPRSSTNFCLVELLRSEVIHRRDNSKSRGGLESHVDAHSGTECLCSGALISSNPFRFWLLRFLPVGLHATNRVLTNVHLCWSNLDIKLT